MSGRGYQGLHRFFFQKGTNSSSVNPFDCCFFSNCFSLARHTQAIVQTTHSRSVTLRALHALLYTVKRLIVRWHAALFMLQHSCGQGSRRGHCEAGDFHANLAFSFLDNTQRPITIYTRARVSLLSSCSLEHGPSIIAEKRAVETQFLRWVWPLPRLKGFIPAFGGFEMLTAANT